tara:strand:- start:306 stop:929 length:624 start_codon:yes stop_codon:yes gene_type:complete
LRQEGTVVRKQREAAAEKARARARPEDLSRRLEERKAQVKQDTESAARDAMKLRRQREAAELRAAAAKDATAATSRRAAADERRRTLSSSRNEVEELRRLREAERRKRAAEAKKAAEAENASETPEEKEGGNPSASASAPSTVQPQQATRNKSALDRAKRGNARTRQPLPSVEELRTRQAAKLARARLGRLPGMPRAEEGGDGDFRV